MTEQQENPLPREAQIRVAAAKEARTILAARGFASTAEVHVQNVIQMADWILTPTEMDDVAEEVKDTDTQADREDLPFTVVLDITYASPVTTDTLNALIESHQDDEDVLRVDGHLRTAL